MLEAAIEDKDYSDRVQGHEHCVIAVLTPLLRRVYGVVRTLRKMHNRFNRPFTSEQVQLTLNMLREGAQARKQIDSQGSDLLYKGLHVIQMLWRECTLHDHLEETAAQTLATVETALTDCMEREAVAEAAKIVEDVRRLKAVIEKPEDTFATWTSDAAAPR